MSQVFSWGAGLLRHRLRCHLCLQVFHYFLQESWIQVEEDVQLSLSSQEWVTLQLGTFGFELPHDFLHDVLQTLQLRLHLHQLHRQLLRRPDQVRQGARKHGGERPEKNLMTRLKNSLHCLVGFIYLYDSVVYKKFQPQFPA